MRFSTGVLFGFAAGYYLGSKAGRDRYHQIEDVLDSVRRTDSYRQLRDRVSSAVEVGGTRINEFLDDVAEEAQRQTEESSKVGPDPSLN